MDSQYACRLLLESEKRWSLLKSQENGVFKALLDKSYKDFVSIYKEISQIYKNLKL